MHFYISPPQWRSGLGQDSTETDTIIREIASIKAELIRRAAGEPAMLRAPTETLEADLARLQARLVALTAQPASTPASAAPTAPPVAAQTASGAEDVTIAARPSIPEMAAQERVITPEELAATEELAARVKELREARIAAEGIPAQEPDVSPKVEAPKEAPESGLIPLALAAGVALIALLGAKE